MAGAFDGALAAGQADGLVDVGEIVRHGDRAGRADLLTDAAADAADLTHPPRVLAGVFVGALDGDGVRAFVDADELTRAFAHAFAAGDALVLVDSATPYSFRAMASNLHTFTHSSQPTQPYWHSAVARQPPLQATKAAL